MKHIVLTFIFVSFFINTHGCLCIKNKKLRNTHTKATESPQGKTSFSSAPAKLMRVFIGINEKDKAGNTQLHRAVLECNKDAILDLLAKGALINAKNYFHKTPLHSAAENGYSEIVEILINHGAEITARDNSGKTAIHLAAANGQLSSVALILKSNVALLNIRDDNNKTPLDLARQFGHTNIVSFLQEK